MRNGRRKRLGLVEGSEGTVGDTYLDRILSDQEAALQPNTYNLGEADANVSAEDQRQYSDAYQFLLGGGFPEEATPVLDTPVLDTPGGGDGGDNSSIYIPHATPVAPPGGETLVTQEFLGPSYDMTGGVTNDNITVENIAQNQTPYDVPMDPSNPGASIENIIAQQNQTIPDDPSIDAVPVKTSTDAQGNMYSMEEDTYGNYIGNKNDEFGTDGDVYADAGSMVTAEDVQDEQKFMDKFKGLLPENFDFKKAVINGLVSAVTGKPIMMALDILKGSLSETGSQTEYNSYSSEQKAAIDEAYGSGGVMEGYNAVSQFGKGPLETIQKRIDDRYQNVSDPANDRIIKELETLRDELGGNTLDDITGDEPDDIEDFLNEPAVDKAKAEAAMQQTIRDAEKAESDRVEKANKAAADKAKAEADMQQTIRDAEKAESDRVEKANKAAADKAKAEADMQQTIRDAEKAEKARKDKEDRDKQNEQDTKDNQTKDESGNTTGGSCFIAGTKVTMADGTLKNIEDVEVGDKVKGHKEENTVIKLDPTLLADRKLYSFNNNEHYFFTSEHPFMTEEGWKSIKPEKTKERDGIELYKQLKGELKVGDKLVTDNDSIEITDIKSKEMNNPEMPLYNFNVSNDSSYIADDYVVHNKGCFIKGTLITMADGTTKPVEQVDLGDEVAVGGKVFAVGRFLNTELYEYKGIKVSGSHMVNEDGTWMRVRDTKHGKSLGDDQNTVYVFGSENRRILINGILFTDYFEVNEQDMLMNDEKDFFNNSKKYGKVIDEHNVEILNAN